MSTKISGLRKVGVVFGGAVAAAGLITLGVEADAIGKTVHHNSSAAPSHSVHMDFKLASKLTPGWLQYQCWHRIPWGGVHCWAAEYPGVQPPDANGNPAFPPFKCGGNPAYNTTPVCGTDAPGVRQLN